MAASPSQGVGDLEEVLENFMSRRGTRDLYELLKDSNFAADFIQCRCKSSCSYNLVVRI